MKKLYSILLIVFSFAMQAQETYKNPIPLGFDGFGVGDAATFRWMGKYYLLISNSPQDLGLNCWQSEDMFNWTHVGKIIDGDDKDFGAPEVLYHEGVFYLYTSYHVGGEDSDIRVYKYEPNHFDAKLPLGPYTKVTDDLVPSDVHGIDPSPFRDNNGDLYITFSGHGGIKYKKLLNPYTDDNTTSIHQYTTCKVSAGDGEWTEGPTVNFVDGTYYMTYCGNNLIDPRYQVHAGKGTSFSQIWAQSNNPIIKQTTGDWTGTGHNHWSLGPDLKTYYTVYHAKRNDQRDPNCVRQLMLSKIEFESEGGNILPITNIFAEQAVPELPDWSDDFNRTTIGNEWTFTDGGAWGLDLKYLMWGNSKGNGGDLDSWWSKAISTQVTGDDFVIEFNLKLWEEGPDEANASPKFGVFVSQQTENGSDEDKIMYIALDIKANQIATMISTNNNPTWQGDGVSLGGSNLKKWHTIRVKKVGSKVDIYYDNMLKISKTNVSLGGGHFGFITENSDANFGWVGYSNIN